MLWYDIKKLLNVSIFYDVMSFVKVVEKICVYVYKKICGGAALSIYNPHLLLQKDETKKSEARSRFL